ncbi:MAG: SIMPL domain-containing protein [Candidatus Binatia bacterium]
MLGSLAVLTLFLLIPTTLHSQEAVRRFRSPSVTANGEAVITVEPDQAEIDVGVVTQARNAPDAARENAQKLARVVAEIKKLLGKGDEVNTAGYSLTPNYRYPREGGKPEITGYTATNVVRVKTGDLDSVGKLIDAAMQTGANRINRLVFTLKDEHGAQLQALRLASTKARAKAEEMANALGLEVIRILSATEVERGFRPILMAHTRDARMEAVAAAPTPIESGTIEVRSSVSLTAEIGPR